MIQIQEFQQKQPIFLIREGINEACKSPIFSLTTPYLAKALVEPDENELLALPAYTFCVASSCPVEGDVAIIALKILQLSLNFVDT